MKSNITLLFLSTFITLILIEILTYYNFKDKISINIIHTFPGSKLKYDLLIERGIKKNYENIFYRNFNDNYFTLYNKSIKKPATKEDRKFGATDYFFYNKGFCNKEININKTHIISVGDSFTFCTQLKPKDAWPKNISSTLSKSQMINYGLPGVGPFHYNDILKETVNNNTKLITYGFYEGNDFRDMISYAKVYKKPIKNTSNKLIKDSNFKNFLLYDTIGRLYLPNILYGFITSPKTFIPFYNSPKDIDNFNFEVNIQGNKIDFNLGNSDIDEIHHGILLKKDKNRELYFNLLEKSFLEAKIFTDQKKISIIFIFLPSAHNVLNISSFKVNNNFQILKSYHKLSIDIFEEICSKHRLHCINPVKEMIMHNNSSNEITHFPNNLHLTKIGNSIVSESIKQYICKNNLPLLNEKDDIFCNLKSR